VELLETRLAPANVNITSFHYDTSIQGQDTQETQLTPLNVNSSLFGKLASVAVDGYTYAQPLYLTGLMIGGQPHDVAFVSTEHDSVYAFNVVKDATSGAVTITQLWQRSFITGGPGGPTTAGITSVPQPDIISGDIVPEIGITGAPVIDAGSGTLYVVAKTKEVRTGDATPHYVQTLHALDVTTGADKYVTTGNGGYVIGDTHGSATFANETTTIIVPGQGAETSGGANPMVAFSALKENQRPSLQLLNGRVYVAWASHGDNGPYHGWVVGFNETTLQPEKWFNTAPNGGLSGIWQSEGALSTDGRYLYFAIGNGGGAAGFAAFDPAHGNYSESVLKIDTQATGTIMPVSSFFTPFNWASLDAGDTDLGSGGVMLLPDSVGSTAHPHLMVETGKDGHIYLLDRDNLGGFTSGGPNNIVQDVVAGPGGVWGNPAFYQESGGTAVGTGSGLIFYHGSGSDSRVFRITNGQITQVSGSFIAYRSNQTFGFPGANPVISANGSTNPSSAVIWEVQLDNYGSQGPANLHAYALPVSGGVVQPTGTLTELYNSNQAGTRDRLSASVKFTSAVVTNGLVFVAQGGGPAAGNPASGTFNVFGEFPPPTQAPAAPQNLTAMGVATNTIQLNWANPSPQPGAFATAVQIFRSVGDDQHFGTTPYATAAATATTYTDTVTDPNQVYYYKVRAHNQIGDSAFSNEASATPFVQPVLSLVNVASNAVALSWTRPPVANNRFDVERSSTPDFATSTTIAAGLSTNTTTYTDTSAALVSSPGTYYYRIRAYSTAATTPFALSNVVGVKVGPNAGVINYGPPNGFPAPPAPSPFDLQANGDAQFAETTARLTSAAGHTGSVFSASPENILNWTTTFNVRLHEGTQPYYANGFAFVIQALGPNALGQGLTGLGYQGIPNSVAFTFDTFTNGFNPAEPTTHGGAVGLFVNGDNPAGTPGTGETRILLNPATDHVNLDSQSTKTITLSYNFSTLTLHEVIVDNGTAGGTFTHDYMVNIPALLGIAVSGNTIGYVGFTGSTGSIVGQPGMQAPGWELQDVLNWVYTPNGPAAPNHLTVVSGATSNTLNWRTTSADDQGYYIERSTSPTTGFTRIMTVGAGITTFTDTGLTNPQQYYYRVQQFNHNGTGGTELDSGYSNVATGATVNVNFPGFPNGNGFTANTGNPPVVEFPGTPAVLRLTDGRNSEGTSVWYNTVIGTGAFTTTFTLKDVPNGGAADSASFVIQSDPRGTAALGGGGGAGGYAGIINSLAIKFDLYTHGSHNSSTGLFTNGQAPDGFPAQDVIMGPTPIDLRTGDPMQITLTYDGGTRLDETVHDNVTGANFSHTYTLPMTLAQIIGGQTAYVGFTGATGGENATQDILNWTGSFPQAPPQIFRFTVSANPTSITAGQTTQVTVTAFDQNGNVFTGYTGMVHFSSNDAQVTPGSGLPANYTFTAADMGVHTFTVQLKTAGNDTVTVIDTAHLTATGTATVAVTPAATSALSVTGFPTLATRGTPSNFTVAAVDAYGNITPAYRGTVHFTSSDTAAVLPGDPTTHNYTFIAADNGTHTFSATLNTVGVQSITATDTGTASITGTESGINVQLAGVVTINYPNGFADQTNLTTNGSASFVEAVNLFTNHQDIGTAGDPTPAGNATFNNGTYTLTAGGSDVWDVADHFQYDYKSLTGDGQIIARIVNPETSPDYWTKAGVMFRTDTTVGSADEFMLYTPNTGHEEPIQQWRDTAGGGTGDTGNHPGGDVGDHVPIWLRLDRVGNNFTGYWAMDAGGRPGTWQLMTTHTTVMPATVLVGLALTSHSNGNMATATFDHVSVTGNPPAVGRLTDGGAGEAGSLWYNTPVGPGGFSTTFTLRDQPVGGAADSLNLVIQNDPRGLTALGGSGGGGGYAGIVNSIDIKFDLFNHGNHMPSTGLFLNGQAPDSSTAQDVPLPDDILRSGHRIQVTISYDGSTIHEALVDLDNLSTTFSHDYTNINLAQLLGGNAAYVGFTGGTGGETAIQDILNWTGTFQQAGTIAVNFPNFANNSTLTANTNSQNPPLNVFPTTPNGVTLNFPNFNTHTSLVSNGSGTFTGTPTALQLTDGNTGEAGSVWYTTRIVAGNFTTQFVIQSQPVIGMADNLDFVIQNDPRGTAALGAGGGGGGYAGIANSIAIKFDLYSGGTHTPTTGLYTGGTSPGEAPGAGGGRSIDMSPINLGSNHPLQVTLTYSGTTLTETVLDTVTMQMFTHNYTGVNLAQILGPGTALVGFSGGTGGETAIQKVTSWTGSFTGPVTAMQLTDGRGGEATSVFLNTPIGTGQFSTSFTLQNTPHDGADSLSFVIQADPRGTTALGGGGGGGGYSGITNSIAIKFDLWNHGNHEPYSTGLFTGGMAPDSDTSRDVPLTPIALGSGDPLLVTLSYNGTTLHEMIVDTVTHDTFNHDYPLNLAQVIGANSAYVGFTAGTGGVSSTQKILNWTGTFAPALPTRLAISAPSSVPIGAPFQVTVTAVDLNGNPLGSYFGTVHFASSDQAAGLPSNYTFAIGDNGSHTFTVTLKTVGTQTLTVSDTNMTGPAINGTVSINAMLDFTNGFANNGDLQANGSATFVGPNSNAVGIFTGHQDIGTPGDPSPAGSATFANGVYTVKGAGSDIWNNADNFHYAYEALTGNGEIIARLLTETAGLSDYSKAGVMFRNSLAADAENAFMLEFPNPGGRPGWPAFQWRTTTGNGSADNLFQVQEPMPMWLRVVRSGNTFTGYWALDNNGSPGTWQQQGTPQTIAMGATAYVGLAVTSHNNGALSTTTFDHVQVIGNTSSALAPTVAELTDGQNGEAGSIFTKTKVPVTSFAPTGFPATGFTTTFVLRDQAVNGGGADDMLFVLQNDSRGSTALGDGGGHAGYFGITPSVAIKFDLWTNGSHNPTTGLFMNGESPSTGDQVPVGSKDVAVTGGLSFLSGDPIQVTLTYNGTTLTEFLRDTVTGQTFSHDYLVNLSQILGGTTAYAGFTAGTGGASAIQDILSWTYQSIPVPPTASLTFTPIVATATAGTPFAITITALDAGGHRVAYTGTLHFTSLTDPQGVVPANYTFTAADNGQHTFMVTLKTAGNQAVTFNDVANPALAGLVGASVSPAAASTLSVTEFPSPTASGASAGFIVTARDPYGNVAPSYRGTVHITSSDPQASLPADYTFTAADNGVHAFSAVLRTLGTQSITATDTTTATITGTQSGIVVTPKALVVTFPTEVTAGDPQVLTVTAVDASGTVLPNYTGTVHFTSTDPQARSGIELPADYTFTLADQGTHNFVAILKTAGTQTITATDQQIVHGTTAPVLVDAADFAAFAVTSTQSTVVAGTPVNYTVTAKDAYGNTVTAYTGTVTFSSSDPQSLLPDDTPFVANDHGSHNFLAILETAGSQSITATDIATGFSGAKSFTVTPAAAASLVITGPTAVNAGAMNSFTVTLLDQFGNVATGYAGTVHFTSTDPQVMAGSGLPANYTFVPATDHGVHIFTGVTLKTAGTQSIFVNDTAAGTTISQGELDLQVNPAAATHFGVTGYPTPSAAGAGTTIHVNAQDPYGNIDPNYTGTIHITSSDPHAFLDNDYTFTPQVDAGQADFLATLFTAGTQSITVTDAAHSITGSQTGIIITPAGLDHFTVAGYPSSTTAGAPHPVTVTAVDPYGNRIPNYTGIVTVSSSDPQVPPLMYQFTQADMGQHSFTVTLKTAGTQSIAADDDALVVHGEQDNIQVNAAAAASLVITGPTAVSAGVASTFTVTLYDAFGNVATGYTGTIHFSSDDTSASLPANYTFTAADAGTHDFNNVVFNDTSTTHYLRAVDTVMMQLAGEEDGIVVS
jgi:hypothetical protein